MKISSHVESALIDAAAKRHDAAILHACIAVDGTARRMYPTEKSNSKRFKKCIRHFYWMVEPALGMGIDLEKTRFSNISLKANDNPDLADIVYEVFRCAHAHGDEVPMEYELVAGTDQLRIWCFSDGILRLPDTLLFALLFIAVFAPVNKDEQPLGEAWLGLGAEPNKDYFIISEWWGRSAALRPIAEKHNTTRVHLTFPFDPARLPIGFHHLTTVHVNTELNEAQNGGRGKKAEGGEGDSSAGSNF